MFVLKRYVSEPLPKIGLMSWLHTYPLNEDEMLKNNALVGRAISQAALTPLICFLARIEAKYMCSM